MVWGEVEPLDGEVARVVRRALGEFRRFIAVNRALRRAEQLYVRKSMLVVEILIYS